MYLPLLMAYQEVLMALADPMRRTILHHLSRQPQPVQELAQKLPVSRPAVSQHLRILAKAGLVHQERVGTRRIYTVNVKGIAELRGYLEQFWEDAISVRVLR